MEGHGKDARRTQGRGEVKGEGQRGGTEVKSERARWRGRERQVRERGKGKKLRETETRRNWGSRAGRQAQSEAEGTQNSRIHAPRTRGPTSPSPAGIGCPEGWGSRVMCPIGSLPSLLHKPSVWDLRRAPAVSRGHGSSLPQGQLLRPSWTPSGGLGPLSHSPPRAPSAGEKAQESRAGACSSPCDPPSQALISARSQSLP